MKSKVYIDQASVGLGVIAKSMIEEREAICFITGPILSFEECISLPNEGVNTFQIGVDAYVDPLFPGRFVNHSCEPNAGLVDDTCLIALRRIEPGEEIRYDYSTALMERFWALDCQCGSKSCRGMVGDFDTLPQSLQSHYLSLGIVQKFIVEMMESQLVPQAGKLHHRAVELAASA